jgi:subtilase family serine protease
MTPPGGAASWKIFGGTSAGAPQWAGMMAVANAQRVFAGKAALTIPHAALYTGIAAVPGRYVSAFYDVTTGVNGTTAQATARAGYDIPTGLGTPNFNNLSTLLKSY